VTITRRAALTIAAAASGLVALGIAAPVLLWREVLSPLVGRLDGQGGGNGGGMMGGGMMGAATTADMSSYMDLFDQHTQIRRTVEQVPGGVRTITESDDPALAARLQAHVSSMYTHLQQGREVQCMSDSLPLLFRNASGYQRRLTLTAKGVTVIETSGDPKLTDAIRAHAKEVSGFVKEGMPAMMGGMMGG
jgi:hypothetical protein